MYTHTHTHTHTHARTRTRTHTQIIPIPLTFVSISQETIYSAIFAMWHSCEQTHTHIHSFNYFKTLLT